MIMDDEAAALGSLIGERVRLERKRRSWTRTSLANARGSRRMLVTIEQGATNPSIATLLRLSDALGVGLPALVAPGPSVTITRQTGAGGTVDQSGGRAAYLAAGTSRRRSWNCGTGSWGPGDEHRSEVHSAGTRELMTVLKGTVRLTVGEQTWDLRTGDAASFAGDVEHGYANPGTSPSRFSLTVYEPHVGAR